MISYDICFSDLLNMIISRLLWILRCLVLFWTRVFTGNIPRSGIAGSYCNSIFSFLRNLHSDCGNFHAYQQCRKIPFSQHSLQHLLFVDCGTRDQIANIRWIIEKEREFQKNIYFCFIDYAKAFDCVDYNKLWNILQEMGIPDHLTCLPGKPNAGQEATVRPGHETTDWFKTGKGVHQGCILSPCLFNLNAECCCC